MSAEPTQSQSDLERQRSQPSTPAPPQPPTNVPGYEPQLFLGAGAYGEVWVALDRNTGRRVAIKFYAHRRGVDWSLLQREVEKLVVLSADRYVVQLLDVGWNAEPPYYVMEYIEQGSLEDYLQQHGPMAPHEAVEVFREVVIGLSHAHGKGVLHCDLKPANILLDLDHKPRLADFGQSRLSHEQRPALGTLFYMAPEQADLEAVPDARWDVYALGALLYCMITGEPPYRSSQAISEMDSVSDLDERLARYRDIIRTAPAPTQHRRAPGVDRALAEIIDGCLALDPRHRYASVHGVLEALHDREASRVRRPLVVLGFVAPALLLLTMSLFGWRGYRTAVYNSDQAVTKRAMESNQFAAKFAAEVVSRELSRYFQAVEETAADPRLQQLVDRLLNERGVSSRLEQLAEPVSNDAPLQTLRQDLVANRARLQLQQYIERLLSDPAKPRVASWVLADARGTFLAAAFDKELPSSVVGRNFAYRTYYHGGLADLPMDARPSQRIQTTHLSALLKSTATKTWKVAISTPVRARGETLGIIALTVELREFMKLFHSNDPKVQFAVLVDGRGGDYTGVILSHPLYDKLLDKYGELPDRVVNHRVDLERWRDTEVQRYEDPMRQDSEGGLFQRNWIAAKAAVRLNDSPAANGDAQFRDTGLLVFVQEDYGAMAGPVHQLGQRLLREGLMAFGVTIVMVLTLWYFVVRSLGEQSRTASLANRETSPPVPLHSRETVELPSRAP